MTHRVILVGCGKTKRASRSPARDLYTGGLFVARRGYAEATTATHGGVWRVLSAKLGVVEPDTWVDPYELHIGKLTPEQRAAWVGEVFSALRQIAPLAELCIEIHAGRGYVMPLMAHTAAQAVAGPEWRWPLRGLGLGEQLGWYKEQRSQLDIEDWLSAAGGGR